MLKKLPRVLLLTMCLLFMVLAGQPAVPAWADGDPDEIIERCPDPDPESGWPPPGQELPPGEEMGDPDEIIEGQSPFAPQLPGLSGDGAAIWLTLDALQSTLFLIY
ncbi:MAG: hypothetical protein PVF43_08230 [Candidatus Eiseniibacteriota bacterium]|jgi:hypothetical protein